MQEAGSPFVNIKIKNTEYQTDKALAYIVFLKAG